VDLHSGTLWQPMTRLIKSYCTVCGWRAGWREREEGWLAALGVCWLLAVGGCGGLVVWWFAGVGGSKGVYSMRLDHCEGDQFFKVSCVMVQKIKIVSLDRKSTRSDRFD
jgi:hypothetical protein